MAHAPYPYMLSGNLNGSPPVNSIGAEGNYFFDESNGNIWGPKTNGVWPSPPATPAYPGGGGTPGGSSGQYQYNDSGAFGGIGRILFANTTFYASDSGSTGNTGLSALSPWPLQYMFDQMAFVDANGFGVTLQSADGSYAAAGTNQCFSILYRPRNASFFYIYGNTTTPGNCVVDGIDGTPLGFLFGQNADTGAIAKVLVDEFGGFHVKNAASHTTLVTGSSIGNMVNSKSEDNYEGFVVRQYSTVGDVKMTYAGNHGILVESDTGIINSWTPTFETGATCNDTVFVAAVYGYLGCGNQDYTNLDATLAIQYFVDNFGFLDASGNAAGIPGNPGNVAPFGAVN